MDSCIEAFGTTKQKRALNSRRMNRVGNESLNRAVAKAAESIIDTKGVTGKHLELGVRICSQGQFSLLLRSFTRPSRWKWWGVRAGFLPVSRWGPLREPTQEVLRNIWHGLLSVSSQSWRGDRPGNGYVHTLPWCRGYSLQGTEEREGFKSGLVSKAGVMVNWASGDSVSLWGQWVFSTKFLRSLNI